jgi:hypothetical protein
MTDGLSERLRPRVLPEAGGHPQARAAAEALAAVAGDSLAGVVFFGSRKSGAGFDRHSAWDFFAVTRRYAGFYRRLRSAGRLRRRPGLVAALNAVLPPNQLRIALEGSAGPVTAKCAVIDIETLERATSAARRDHFCAGRLFQPVEVVYAADPRTAERLFDCVLSAHRQTWTWARPWLPERFDADAYYRSALEVSLAGEIRPESSRRAMTLWEAQVEHRRAVYPWLLAELEQRGELVGDGGAWRPARAPGALERLRLRLYFAVSKVRATLRWFKYVVTFDDWLDYILQKVERHTGRRIELTPAQKRYPLVLLWPALFRHLREKEKAP